MHGNGRFETKEFVYKGPFWNDIKNGLGVLESFGNYKFEGNFTNDYKFGEGVMTFTNEDSYEGNY